jgi:glycosyltransferase involved in cell wall biosynthesis
MDLAPRKHGSLEDWVLAFCREAASRGHQVDAWMREPMLPAFIAEMRQSGARVEELVEFERTGLWAMIRRLSGYGAIHLNFIPPRSRIALAAYAAWPAQVLYTAHSDEFNEAGSLAMRCLYRVMNQATMLRVHSLAGVSEYIRVKEGRRFGLHPHRSLSIPNGVDLQRFSPRPRPRPDGPVRLITVANLVENKGVQHLLRALVLLRSPKIHLRIVGDGPELQALKALAVALGIHPQTEFLGLRNDVNELLATSDIYIQPTLAEAFGLAVAEAMACGCAVVASRVGGINELIEHGKNGLLVAPGDEAGLAAAIDQLLHDPALRHQLGASARQRACEQYQLSGNVRRHVEWCEAAARYVPQSSPRLTATNFAEAPRLSALSHAW